MFFHLDGSVSDKIKIFSFDVANNIQQNKRVANSLVEACKSEPDSHILENMVGDVSWSMKTFLLEQSRFYNNGFVTVCAINSELVGIAGCEINDQVFKRSLQFGIRFWVKPQYRGTRGLLSDILRPQLLHAKSLGKIAWTSFNLDRTAMLRMISIKATSDRADIGELWDGFEVLPKTQILNNVEQSISYKDFGKLASAKQ